MNSIYHAEDDILEIRFNGEPIVREVSQDWNLNLSYAADGSLVRLVVLDAVKIGCIPFTSGAVRAAAAAQESCTDFNAAQHIRSDEDIVAFLKASLEREPAVEDRAAFLADVIGAVIRTLSLRLPTDAAARVRVLRDEWDDR